MQYRQAKRRRRVEKKRSMPSLLACSHFSVFSLCATMFAAFFHSPRIHTPNGEETTRETSKADPAEAASALSPREHRSC